MRFTTVRRVLIVSLIGWTGSAAVAQDAKTPESARAKYDVLLKEFARAQKDYMKSMQAASDLAAEAKLFREKSPHPDFAGRFLELAKKHPKDAVAYDCLTWIVQNSECGAACEVVYNQAVALLAQQHAEHKDSERNFERMIESPFASSAQYLQAVFAKHPDEAVRGRAGFHLALFWKNYCATMEHIRSRPENIKRLEPFVGPDLLKQLTTTDPAPLLRRAEEMLVQVQRDYGLVTYKRTFLAKAAAGELFELRNLAVGKTIPEIEGDDTQGKKLKLSDYRGKVVVLVFWGMWCGHCVAMLPQKRTLAKKYEGQPFALVGVNSDADREKLKPFYAKERITWPSFWDADDAISSRWNILGWPAIFVLDGKGVIRYRQVRGEMLDQAVEELMKEGNTKR